MEKLSRLISKNSKKQRIGRILKYVNLQIFANHLHSAQVGGVDRRQQYTVFIFIVTVDLREGIDDVLKLLMFGPGEENRLLYAYAAVLLEVFGYQRPHLVASDVVHDEISHFCGFDRLVIDDAEYALQSGRQAVEFVDLRIYGELFAEARFAEHLQPLDQVEFASGGPHEPKLFWYSQS